jgi:hypothetical protein
VGRIVLKKPVASLPVERLPDLGFLGQVIQGLKQAVQLLPGGWA